MSNKGDEAPHSSGITQSSQLKALRAELGELKNQLLQLRDFIRVDALAREDRERDILALLLGEPPAINREITLSTQYPVAYGSDDHKFPRGTLNDNTRHPRFVSACERVFGRKVTHLDLGCAGGGLVWDFLINGHLSIGVEGSDYSRMQRRAEWRTVPSHLFTADITKPFHLSLNKTTLQFDVITAWEVLEHIPERLLDGLVDNIVAHLNDGGMFVASVATFEDADPETGATWHVTVKPCEWWLERFRLRGLVPLKSPFDHADYVRGSGNPRSHDWDRSVNAQLGFHLVLCKKHV